MLKNNISLKWVEFSSNIKSSFQNLRNDTLYNDVTLVSDDQVQVSAHKVVLSSCSGFFKNILSKNIHPQLLLCLDGINAEELNNVMDYIYNGEVKIGQNEIDRFLTIAQKLQLEGLLNGDSDLGIPLGKEITEDMKVEITTHDYEDNDDSDAIPQIPDNFDLSSELHETEAAGDNSNSSVHNRRRKQSIKTQQQDSDSNRIILHPSCKLTMEQVNAEIEEITEKLQGEVNGYKCKLCNKCFRTKTHIKEHIETHLNILFLCLDCGRTGKNRHSLKYHHKCNDPLMNKETVESENRIKEAETKTDNNLDDPSLQSLPLMSSLYPGGHLQ